MLRQTFVTVMLASAAPAFASDKPIYAPTPVWVKPVAVPPPAAKPDEAPIRILLSDQQVAFEPGKQTSYSDVAMLIQTPQGLDVGNLSFPWNPETSDLVIHKLEIRRGDKRIDVLASGQTFTVLRRETNLESAILDGMLTASIQPDGLQVGDILQFAASIVTRDPTMKGHVEAVAAGWDMAPIARAHLRMQWPASMSVKVRQSGAVPVLKPTRSGADSVVEFSLDGLDPVPGPKGAPLRYQFGRRVEASDFASWGDVAALLAPLYATAATLPTSGPLADEVARIAALSPDAKVRAEAALALVQDRIRYVALAMGAGGLVPADVATTWSRRYGDCKAKTAMLIALLTALGVTAEPVLVSSRMGDGLDERLPMVGAFDHVLVRADIAGRSYWLDGTRKGDTGIDRLQVPDVAWGLPVRARGAALLRIAPGPLDVPQSDVRIRIDARAGLTSPAPTTVETVFRGDAAIAVNTGIAALTGDARDRSLRAYWKREYTFIEPTKVGATFDPKTGEARLTLDGTARMDWSSGWYETDGTSVGYTADFTREPGPDRDAPFAVAHPLYSRNEETILLPPGFPDDGGIGKGDIDRVVAGIAYKRTATLSGGVFRVVKTERSLMSEFPAKDAPAAQAALRDMAKSTLYIRQPASYRPSDAEVAAQMEQVPKTTAEYNRRGNTLLDRGRFDDAVKDFDAALALSPKDETALANRGLTYVWTSRYDLAAKDLAAALAIDPRHAVALRARGFMAFRKGDYRAAVDDLTASLRSDPGNTFALYRRAFANRSAGNDDAALADAAEIIAANPKATEGYALRANIYRARGQQDRMLAEAAALVGANPDDAYAHVVAARFYSLARRDADAAREFDRALAIKPEAYIYLNRATTRPATDRAGRMADYDAALKLDPAHVDARMEKARLMADSGELPGAIALLDRPAAGQDAMAGLIVQRGILRARAKDDAGAERDFVAARAAASNPADLNNICWAKATAGVALASAMVDCDKALAAHPDEAAFLDSKALVLLRLGRIDDAIATYDRALAKAPGQTSSLYGRAIAWSRKRDAARAAADRAAALKISPEVDRTYADYGLTIDTR